MPKFGAGPIKLNLCPRCLVFLRQMGTNGDESNRFAVEDENIAIYVSAVLYLKNRQARIKAKVIVESLQRRSTTWEFFSTFLTC